jgi:uncharacterized damage-inducible protein DinB
VNVTDYLRRQFSYDAWANREVLSAMRPPGGGDARSLQLLSHILAAERLWMERLEQQPQSTPVWPERDFAQCEAEVSQLSRLWNAYLASMTDEKLAQTVPYNNSKGERWESAVGDILTHVVMHSAYHRGQIASHMRGLGETPAYTDFIHGVRQGLVE